MIVENLRQFGLGEKEISVYLSLVSMGPSPVRLIAKQSGVNRGTTYDILKNLIELGLASYYKQYGKEDKKQYFVAEPPQKLLDAVENKKRGLTTLAGELKKSLPELESFYEKSGAKPVVKYYEGQSGVRTILQDVIATMSASKERVYYVYSSADIREHLHRAYPKYSEDRVRAGISVRVVGIGRGRELQGLDERKSLSEEEHAPSYVLIYGGKLAMVSLDASGHPVGVIVENEGLYRTQELVFQSLWATL